MRNRRRKVVAGFTMIELITVMILVGILSVVALPRFDALSSFDAAGYADQTAALLRYGQKTAIAQRRWVAVKLAAPPTLCSQAYVLLPAPVYPTCAAACVGGASVALPGGASTAPKPSTTLAGVGVYCFDAAGRPFVDGAIAPAAATSTTQILDAGAVFRTIAVEAETGYVHTQ